MFLCDIERKDLTIDDTANVIEHDGTGDLTVKPDAGARGSGRGRP